MKRVLLICLALAMPAFTVAQRGTADGALSSLPAAPMPRQTATPTPTPQSAPMPGPQGNLPQNTPGAPTVLSLQGAQALALKNNPQISVARLTALASVQVTREVRSNLWPTATVDLTAVDANTGARITAGALNNPIIYERAAGGALVSQLLTDFGRTTNLISSANLAAKAENQNAVATKEQILLAVDQGFYNALQSHAVLTVAQQTVKERQTVADQIGALFKSKLKSELDLSFANVNLAQAKLLLLDAQNNENAALASLSAVLGFSNLQNFQLAEDSSTITVPPGNVDDLIATAFAMRPEILALEFESESAKKFHIAERDLLLPNIRALAAVGDTPIRNPLINSNWYGAAG
jgi:outer membrane protein